MDYFSKTAFLKYDQCAKAFFLYKRFPFLRDPVSKEKQFTFNRGHEVGHLAQKLFPGGTDASLLSNNAAETAEITKKLIGQNTHTIYEATFIYNDVLVMVDILHYNGNSWNAYEVKSSLKISEIYIKDACLQYYVLKNVLPGLNDFFLVTLNGEYVRENELNVQQLFKKRSIRTDGEKNLDFFDHKITEIRLLLEQNVTPEIKIGKQCFSPYTCDFFGTCWKNVTKEKSVFNIGKTDKEQLFQWYYNGWDTTDKIVFSNDTREQIKIQAACINSGKEYRNVPEIKKFLKTIHGNCCFLDMEIWSPAVPYYSGHKPFEQLPFLFSICYKKEGACKFYHHLLPERTNDLRTFTYTLIYAVEKFDCIVVYDKNLELQVLSKLETMFPEFAADLKKIGDKIIDLSIPVQQFYYFHPGFKNNFSLKAISEIMHTTSEYEKLDIQSGIVAMYKYESLLSENNPIHAETLKQQLIDYCNEDTLTSLRFYEYLQNVIKD